MISIQEGRFVPMYFNDIIDPLTKRTKVRMVDTQSEYYQISRRYMLRLTKEDFEDPHELAKYAATAGISLEAFRKRFYYIAESDVWQMPDLNPNKFPKKITRVINEEIPDEENTEKPVAEKLLHETGKGKKSK